MILERVTFGLRVRTAPSQSLAGHSSLGGGLAAKQEQVVNNVFPGKLKESVSRVS